MHPLSLYPVTMMWRFLPTSVTTNVAQQVRTTIPKPKETNGKLILLEFNTMASAIISYSYIADALMRIHGGVIVGYIPTEKMGKRFRKKKFLDVIIKIFSTQCSPKNSTIGSHMFAGALL